MSSQPESRLSQKIMTELRLKGYFCFKVHGGPTMMAGLPDIIACVGGYFVGFETKMPSKRSNTTVRQDYVHSLINEAGGICMVITSAQEALRICEELLKVKS